jgi:DNA-binding response OmpR family regulator
MEGVLFVDDDEDLRELMQDLLSGVGIRRFVMAGSLHDVESRRSEALQCTLAILDINLGDSEPSGVAVSEWLKRQGFAGSIVFLTGHGSNDPRVREATEVSGSRIVSKPLSLAELRALVESAAC